MKLAWISYRQLVWKYIIYNLYETSEIHWQQTTNYTDNDLLLNKYILFANTYVENIGNK